MIAIAPKVWQFVQTLEPEVARFLLAQPAWAERLANAERSPLSPYYAPQRIELFVDGLRAGCWEQGIRMPLCLVPEDYRPTLVEVVFDGQLAWAMCLGKQIVDRTQQMRALTGL